MQGPIGVFDSGVGGLTILRQLREALPEVDFLYLGDNARAPYGTRSFDLIYRFTLQAVEYLFAAGCPLVILACNTASAKALRTIQQNDLPRIDSTRRVLGVIRPTVEAIAEATHTGHVGLVGTPGTIASGSYDIEIAKHAPGTVLHTHACPMWVPLVENNEASGPGADYFVKKDLDTLLAQDQSIDTLILGCTHYPLLLEKIKKYLPEGINVLSQGKIVAASLVHYLHRHPDIASRISQNGTVQYLTTEWAAKFNTLAATFMRQPVASTTIKLG